MFRLSWVDPRWLAGIVLAGVLLCAAPASAALPSCADFPGNIEIGETLGGLADRFPERAVYHRIGESVEGRPLHALILSPDLESASYRPAVRVVGGIHGNECQSTAQVMELIRTMVADSYTPAASTDLLSRTTLIFVPLLNPDGYEAVPARRTNANGVDLNRNFSFGWTATSALHGPWPFSEPETRALRDMSSAHLVVLGLSYHTISTYVNAPWNYLPFPPRDSELIEVIGYDYAGDSLYQVVFGYDWYPISGDLNDWSLGCRGTFDWTIELASETELQWEIHGPGAAAFLDWSTRGATGEVRDAATGAPLLARITTEPEGEPVFTHPKGGLWHRVLLPGTYALTAWASGYQPATVSGIVVPEAGTITVDFALNRDGDYRAGFRVIGTQLAMDISHAWYAEFGYANETMPSDALGIRDGWYYDIGAGGEITIDMGPHTRIFDGDGPDFVVVSGAGNRSAARVQVSAEEDGPFREVAAGSGDLMVDIEVAGLEVVRYVKVIDDGDGGFGSVNSGYLLDAVETIAPWREDEASENTDDVITVLSGCTVAPFRTRTRSLLQLLR